MRAPDEGTAGAPLRHPHCHRRDQELGSAASQVHSAPHKRSSVYAAFCRTPTLGNDRDSEKHSGAGRNVASVKEAKMSASRPIQEPITVRKISASVVEGKGSRKSAVVPDRIR